MSEEVLYLFSTYDIRSSANACKTLVGLSGVDISTWEQFVGHESEYRYTDDLVEDVIKRFGHLPRTYLDFNFVYFHVTTSANECEAIKKYGILDLQQAYLCDESELRVFLDRHGIIINIEDALLTYNGKVFDISYNAGNCPRTGTQEYLCWSIGRKFYYDFTTCGFLSVWERSPYGGQVHCRPEILWDFDNLLRLNLSEEWEQSHFPYEIVAQVNGSDIVFDGDDDQSDKDKVLMYLTMAYDTAFGEPFEHILLMKNGIQISPDRIIEIKPLTCWR